VGKKILDAATSEGEVEEREEEGVDEGGILRVHFLEEELMV
jgi:hypothetical protein